jgi:hypothetical protein
MIASLREVIPSLMRTLRGFVATTLLAMTYNIRRKK